MARNRQQQRIDEPTIRPTQQITDDFVPTYSANQINMEGAAAADWTEGFQNLLMQGEKAVMAHRKAEDKALAEAGEAVWGDVSQGMSLEKAVAKYTSTGTTPNGLRKKLQKWVESGEISKSANPFFVRAFEEGKSKQTASLFETTLAAEMQDLVNAAKTQAGPGRHKEMLEAVQQKIAGMMTDDLFEGFSPYGAGHLRGLLVEKGNRMAGLALARAEDEMTTETVESHVGTWVDTVEKSLDANAALGVLTGGRTFADADTTLKDVNRSLSALNDSISDLVPPEQRRKIMEDGVIFMLEKLEARDLDPDAMIDHIEKLADESSRTRENGGTGDRVFGPGGSSRILSKAQSAIHNIERNRGRSDVDFQKGQEFHILNSDQHAWSHKRLEDLSEQERADKNAYIRDLTASRGVGFTRGVMQQIDYYHRQAGPSGGSKSDEDEGLIVALSKDPHGTLVSQYGDPPIGNTQPDAIQNWVNASSPNQEVRTALRGALATANKELRGHVVRLDTNFEPMIHNITTQKEQISFAELRDDAATPAPSGAVEARLREDPALNQEKRKILDQLRHGELQPEEAYAALQSAIRAAWVADGDTTKTLQDQIRQNREARTEALRRYRETQPDPETGESPATTFVGYGSEYFIDKPEHPYEPSSGSAITDWLTRDAPKSVGIWAWKGPGTGTLEEWGKEAVDSMMLTDGIPGLEQIERLIGGTPKATGTGPLNMVARGKNVARWIDGSVAETFQAQNPHDADWMTLDEQFYEDILTDYARAQMPDGLINAAVFGTAEYLLGEDTVTKQWKTDLLNHGTAQEFVESYLGIAKSVTVDKDGKPTMAVGPEAIPSWSVTRLPENIYESELAEVYPTEAATSPKLAANAYKAERQMLGDSGMFLLNPTNPQEQRVKMNIHEIVSGSPLLERQWATSKKIYSRFYGPYNHGSETARAQISHIWRHLSESENARKVQLDG